MDSSISIVAIRLGEVITTMELPPHRTMGAIVRPAS